MWKISIWCKASRKWLPDGKEHGYLEARMSARDAAYKGSVIRARGPGDVTIRAYPETPRRDLTIIKYTGSGGLVGAA